MADAYDLTKLDPNSFEHLANMLALRVLGPGHTGFGPGADGGRDGYFEGETSYPSSTNRWTGTWYIQSKFHKPHLSQDPQKWLLAQIEEELNLFANPESKRKWPDNWIVITNIDPSGVPETGSFDKARALVSSRRPSLSDHFHIWGGSKLIGLLTQFAEVADFYGHFLTPGNVLRELYNGIADGQAELRSILYYLIVTQFDEQQYTRLEQAGSSSDTRPGIHRLFIDLPFRAKEYDRDALVMEHLVRTASKNHRVDKDQPIGEGWRLWRRSPSRARVWFIKGGPGQGKSTIGQYFCQIQRAALILGENDFSITDRRRELATEVREAAQTEGLWPSVPRIPISIELKDFAQWFGRRQSADTPRGILTYLSERISLGLDQEVLVGTLKRALRFQSWFVVFDGLDEVPQDVKDAVAAAVRSFVDDTVVENNADLLTVCTSRPQGYSGQFAELDGPTITLISLSAEQSLRCAQPLLALDRSQEESKKYFQVLKSAIETSSVKELMTTPLQSHIMAIVVRGGAKPPERRWQLFTNFYEVIRSREANRDLPDPRLAKLLREDELLLKTVHNRLGFVLQARAETSAGAQTKLTKTEFRKLVSDAVTQMVESQLLNTVDVLMNATTDRLVLVSTPDDGNHVRFDIRQLQEFFAAEFIYEYVSSKDLRERIKILSPDSHWREVMHFLLSALIESNRTTEMAVATSVLEAINEGYGEEGSERILRRRLARGALLVARLLQEGVLEQDRRIRQQFRNCLEPIGGLTEMSELQVLTRVNQPNSQVWLWNFLMEILRESDPTESIGAALVLTDCVPDGHDLLTGLKAFLIASPRPYLSFVLNTRAFGPDRSNQNSEKDWFVELTLELFLDAHWNTLGQAGISSGIRILEQHRKRVLEIAKRKRLSSTQVRLLTLLLTRPKEVMSGEHDYGVVNVSHFEHDWNSGLPLDYHNIEPWEDRSEEWGILGIVSLIVQLSNTRRLSDLLRLVQSPYCEVISALPRHIQAFIPRLDCDRTATESVQLLRQMNQAEFEHFANGTEIRGLRVKRYSMFSLSGGSCSLEQWQRLVEDYPSIAIWVWSRKVIESGTSSTDILESDAAVRLLLAACLRRPEPLVWYPWAWAELIRRSGRDEGALKEVLLRTAAQEPPALWTRGMQISLPPLTLPQDAVFLPHTVNALLPEFEPRLSGEPDAEIKHRLIRQGCELVSNLDELEGIVATVDFARDVRGAAALLLQITRNSVDLPSLAEFYQAGRQHWFLRALIGYLGLFRTESDRDARLLVGNLSELARESYEDRKQIQMLLAIWRESSISPVRQAGGEKVWLDDVASI